VSSSEPQTGQDWTNVERDQALDVYFEMYELEQRREKYIRRRYYEAFVARHPHRSVKALEYKLQNISACLVEMGFAPLRGMAPAFNYQRSLLPEAAARIEAIESLVLASANAEPSTPKSASITAIVPAPNLHPSKWAELARAEPISRKIDFVAREQANRRLGLAGEEWVVELEKRTLHDAGEPGLAKRVRHVAVEQGDGLGYDVQSFDVVTGAERLIEVKTTRAGIWMPFMLTQNEVRVSARAATAFMLYRVHAFGDDPRVYKLPGALEASCDLTPLSFRALPRAATA
jgi:hypothetical protein